MQIIEHYEQILVAEVNRFRERSSARTKKKEEHCYIRNRV